MIKHTQEKEKRIHSFICFGLIAFIISLFILNASTASADDPPIFLIPPEDSRFVFISDLTIAEIDYNSTIYYSDEGIFIGSPIRWGDNVVTEAVELPSDSTVLKLPNNKIAIRSSNETINLQTFDTNDVVSIDGNYIIANPSGRNFIYTEQIVDLEPTISKSFTSYSISQRIDKLDEYQVKLVFNELRGINTELEADIIGYTINWGDNTVTTVNDDTFELTHIYKKSGTYDASIDVTYSSNDFLFNDTINISPYTEYEGDLFRTYLILKEPENIAVASTGIGGFALLGFALTETGKYKLLSLLTLAIPMFTHIQKDDVLDQFVRGEVYGLIKSNPGVHYNEVMRKLEMKNGTLSYHLHMLEKMEMIKSRREGLKYRVFYPTEMKFPQEERYRLSNFQLEILQIIKENEGIQQKEIAKKLNKKPQTINYNIKILQQAGLINVRKKGRETGCYILKESTDGGSLISHNQLANKHE